MQHNGDQLFLIPLSNLDAASAATLDTAGAAVLPAATGESTDGLAVLSQLSLIQQRVEDIKTEVSSILADHKKYMVTMNTNLCRIAVQPVVRHSLVAPEQRTINRAVKLSKKPRDLFVLWREYEQGLDGQKAARDYTRTERGGDNKDNYARWEVFWNAVESLMVRGHTSDSAIDRIQCTYGRDSSVTQVINGLKKDKVRGVTQI